MKRKQWYEKVFENYAKNYDKEIFTQGTSGECDFIEREIEYNKELKILDVGCGTGRHSIELTKRGYNIVGVDLSQSQLDRAKEKARKEDLEIRFLLADARNLNFNAQFDTAIMLCEGGFPLMETDEMNYEILKNVSKALKKNAKFIFTTLNGLFPIFNSIDSLSNENVSEGNDNTNFDPMTFRDMSTIKIEKDNGDVVEIKCNERYYIPSEITWLLKSVNFNKIEIFGAKIGAYSRSDQLTTKDFEMLVIAQR